MAPSIEPPAARPCHLLPQPAGAPRVVQPMPRQRLSFLLLAAVLASLAAPARADVEYKPEIKLEGLKDKKLSATLEAASQLVQLKDKPPASNAALRRRAEDDLPRLKDVMQASGYWTPTLTYALATGADEKAKATVTVTIDPGPLYRFATVTFRTPTGETPPLLQKLGPGGVGLEIGGPAASAPVAAAEQRITGEYGRSGHPFAKVVDRKAVIDVATHTMAVTYTVDPGAEARFGPFAIEGLNRVDGEFAARRIAWKRGSPYDSRAVEKTRQDLVKTGLFSAVRISHADAPDAMGEVPMTVDLVEGPPRSIGAGIAYNTNLGLGAQAFWQHRNLLGAGENLRVTAGAAQKQLGLALAFRKPDFVGDQNQDFLTNAALLRQNTDAFDSLREQVFVGIERPLLTSLTADFGLSLEHARVTRSVIGNEDYTLFGLPFYIRHDTTDDLLDPTIGGRQTLTLIPYHSLAGPDLNFLTSRIEERHYQRLDDTGRVVLAGFAALGSIVGASRDELPPDKRLYAGGAGSVRGYGFQRAGPLGAGNIPLGGASSLELGVELRYRITDTIGVAPFIEGGNVYDSSFPNSTNLLFGGGIGFRYYTVIGPVRLDLATPFQRRPGDGVVQFYISIGQAF
jgi:translocation and assembly module TamA